MYAEIFLTMKAKGTGHYGCLQVQVFPALSMEKGCKNHRETLCMFWINHVTLQIAGKTHDNYRISPQSVNITGFPHNIYNLFP